MSVYTHIYTPVQKLSTTLFLRTCEGIFMCYEESNSINIYVPIHLSARGNNATRGMLIMMVGKHCMFLFELENEA